MSTTDYILADSFEKLLHAPVTKQSLAFLGMVSDSKEFRNAVRHDKTTLSESVRFVMDEDFIDLANHVSQMPIEKLTFLRHTIRPPYDKMWIEWDEHVKQKTAIASGISIKDFPERIGLLIERLPYNESIYKVQTVMFINGTATYCHIGFQYIADYDLPSTALNQYMSTEDKILQTINNTEYSGNILINEDYASRNDPEMVKRFLDGVAFTAGPITEKYVHESINENLPSDQQREANKILRGLMGGEQGSFRFYVTVIGLMNIFTYTETRGHRERRSRMLNKRIRPYMDYHKVSIQAPRTRVIDWIENKGDGIPRRRHQVRGHYRSLNGKQFWIKPHYRGDSSLGYVNKDYVVENGLNNEN